MTWNARLRVSDLSLINGDTEITAVAHSDETVEAQQVVRHDESGDWISEQVSVPRIYSNTEGEIESVYVVLTIKGQKSPDEGGLKIGDEIQVSGHFTH